MLALLDSNVPPFQLVRHGCRSTRPEEGVENKIARISCDLKYTANESLGFRRVEYSLVWEKLQELLLGLVVCSYLTG